MQSVEGNGVEDIVKHAERLRSLIAGDVVLVEQSMPALDLLVLVLQAFVPVLQTLTFGSDTQPTAS